MDITDELKPVPFAYRFVLVDAILQWLSLGIYNFIIPYQATTTIHKIIFVVIQLLIGGLTLFWVLAHEYDYFQYENGRNSPDSFGEKISQAFGNINADRHYIVHHNFLSGMIRAILVLSVAYMMIVVFVKERNIFWERSAYGMAFSGFLSLFFYGVFVGYISSFSVDYQLFSTQKQSTTPKKKKLVKPVVVSKPTDTEEIPLATPTPPKETPISQLIREKTTIKPPTPTPNSYGLDIPHEVDDNDIALIDMEGHVQNYTSRVQEYALEAVIFSGLLLVGFLISTTAGTIDFVQLSLFGNSLAGLFADIFSMNFKGFDQYELFKTTPENLILLSLCLGLFAALSFLMLLVARLKFNDLIEEIDNAIRKARNYNTKEEEMFVLQLQLHAGTLQSEEATIISNRLAELSQKIATQIAKASTYLHEVEGVLQYVTIFRNIGLSLMVIIILVSLLLFAGSIAGVMLLLGVMIYGYRYFDDRNREKRLAKWRNA